MSELQLLAHSKLLHLVDVRTVKTLTRELENTEMIAAETAVIYKRQLTSGVDLSSPVAASVCLLTSVGDSSQPVGSPLRSPHSNKFPFTLGWTRQNANSRLLRSL